jgi:hypothetical protein
MGITDVHAETRTQVTKAKKPCLCCWPQASVKKKKKNTVNVYVAVEGIINFCTDENIMLRISDFVERLFFD